MFQEILIVGNVGRDPELRYTPSGTQVCNLSVATNRRWNDSNGERQEETVWFRITCWNRLAEVVNEYVTKGRLLFIKGRLQADENGGPRVWTDNQGNPRASFEVTARRVLFLGRNGERAELDESGTAPTGDYDAPPELGDEEIPF